MLKFLVIIAIVGGFIYYFFIRKVSRRNTSSGENVFVGCQICGIHNDLKEMNKKDNKLICKDCIKKMERQ